MNKKTFLIPLVAASVLAATALPAAASAHGYSINDRQAQLDRRIDIGVQRHTLTRAEAAHLRRELHRVERLEYRYRQNGLSRWEISDLDRRMDALSRQIRIERLDRDYGRNDYRNNDRHDGYGRR